MGKNSKKQAECSVCYVAHDDEIHDATLRIHQWFCSQVTHQFEEDLVYTPELAS